MVNPQSGIPVDEPTPAVTAKRKYARRIPSPREREDDFPLRATKKELEQGYYDPDKEQEYYEPISTPRKSKGNVWFPALIAGIFAVIISLGVTNAQLLSKTDFEVNIKGVLSTITGIQNDVKASKDSMTSAVNGLPNQINNAMKPTVDQLNTSVKQMDDRIKGFDGTLASLKDQIATIGTQSSSKVDALSGNMSSNLNTLTKSLSEANAKIDILQNKVSTDATTIQILNTTIGDLKTQLANVINGTTQIGGSGGTTTTTGGVTVTVIGNAFTGSQVLPISNLGATQSVTTSFQFEINNASGKEIKNMQLAVGFQLYQTSSNIAYTPTNLTFTLSSGLGTVWTQQSTGMASVIGFTNASTSGIFGNLGSINQNVGKQRYTMTLTITNGGTATTSFDVYPAVVILTYS